MLSYLPEQAFHTFAGLSKLTSLTYSGLSKVICSPAMIELLQRLKHLDLQGCGSVDNYVEPDVEVS